MIIILFNSCKGQNKEENKTITDKPGIDYKNNENVSNDSILSIVLKSQLVDGKEIGGDEFESHLYTIKDLEASLIIIKEELLKNGYKKPDRNLFNKVLKQVFNRTPDNSSSSNLLFIEINEPCNKTLVYSKIKVISDGLYIIKDASFITGLYAIPELTDYRSRFPELNYVEESKIIKTEPDLGNSLEIPHWKDVSNLDEERKINIKVIVARNKYLFNNDRADFKWLTIHDGSFMRSMVTVFGYMEDKDLLRWVVKSNPYESEYPMLFSKLLWHKTCSGELIFHRKVLGIIAEDKLKAKTIFPHLNEGFISYVLNSSPDDLTFPQKAEIVANIYSWIYRQTGEQDVYTYMGGFAERSDHDNKFSDEFKRRNYYGLPDFKEQWKNAKVSGDGVSYAGQEE